MQNRRDFVKTVAGAAAGMFATGVPIMAAQARSTQAGPAKRREVSVGRRRVKVVDVHGHFVEPTLIQTVRGVGYRFARLDE